MGCKKSGLEEPTPSKDTVVQHYDALAMLKDDTDAENDRANKILYIYNQATVEVAKDPELLSIIDAEMATHKTIMGWPIVEIAKKHPEFAKALGKELRDAMAKNPIINLPEGEFSDIELMEAIDALMIYKKDAYSTVYYRLDKLDSGLDNTTLFGISEDVRETADKDDQILAYDLNNQNYLIGEKDANVSKKPILCIGNGERLEDRPGMCAGNNFGSDSQSSGITERSTPGTYLQVLEHQINRGYNYERRGESEVRGDIRLYTAPTGGYDYHVQFGDGYQTVTFLRHEIWNSENFFNTRNVCSVAFNSYYMAFSTYERDWNSSYKHTPNYLHSDKYTGGRRKWTSEYYLNEAGVRAVLFPYLGATRIVNRAECRYVFKRAYVN